MSGIGEASLILGLISSIITIFDAAHDIYESAHDSSGLPQKTQSAAEQIPLATCDASRQHPSNSTIAFIQHDILKQANRNIVAKRVTEEALESIKPVLEQCEKNANGIKDIFDKIIPTKDASRRERLKKAMGITIKSGKVKEYMEEIFKNLQLLAQYQVFQDTETLDHINEAVEQLRDIPDREEQSQFVHFGTGPIYANTGTGEQTIYNNSGSGNQYTAQNQYFGQNQGRTDAQCLQHLRPTDPRDDKKRIEETKGGLLLDSYRWILENIDYRRWRDDRQGSMLWITGDPGKGKTMLLCGIVDELRKQKDRPYLLSFFFCQATDSRINSATAVLRGLIYLLIQEQPSLMAHVREKYDQAGRELFEDTNAWVALKDIFTKILQDPDVKETILIVDALDECVTNKLQLLDLIRCQTSVPRVKWMVSSRNRPEIEEGLTWTEQKVRLSLELNAESISVAVDHYINHQVGRLAHLKKLSSTTRENVRTHLSSYADNTFLWVALVCQNLQKARSYNMMAKLKQFPPGLDFLYERMLHELDDLDDQDLFRNILALISVVRRPLTLEELGALARIPDEWAEDFQPLAAWIELCGSFLFLRERTVYFVHQSAKDFLLKTLPYKPADLHYSIFSKSLEIMSHILHRDLYCLEAPRLPIEQIQQPLINPLVAVRYSCVYWVDHLIEWLRNAPANETTILDDGGPIATFFVQKSLYWLEALSLLRDISGGVRSLIRLEQTIKETKARYLSDVIRDASRFLQSYKSVIEDYPFQVYASALVFSPTCSLIRESFKQERPSWLNLMPVIESNWSACLQTLEGHQGPVCSAVFSHPSKYLASASYDKTVKIWDLNDGKCLQTLQGHQRPVYSVVFSHDSRHLASASDDETIKIWDTTNGNCLKTLEGHKHTIRSVVFSHDSKYLALVSYDKTVKILDTTNGKYPKTFEGHEDKVNSVAFSYDNKYLASASDDKTVKIWDPSDGTCFKTFKLNGDKVRLVTFSHDSKYLASASSHGPIIKIWNTTDETNFHTLECNDPYICSIIFSYDDKYLALASSSGTIEVWDITNRTRLQTLKGHSASVCSVVFSHDSKYLASASDDCTVKIWDTIDKTYLQILESHDKSVGSVDFSYDSKYLASVSKDETLKIWDTTDGTCLQTLGHRIRSTRSGFFSHNSKYLASVLDNETTIIVWDTTDWTFLRILEGHCDPIDVIVFSYDDQSLASGSVDGTIKIWKTANGTCLQTLKSHHDLIYKIVFSYDGQYLVSALEDGSLKFWNTNDGIYLQMFEGQVHDGIIYTAAFSYNNKYLASGSSDQTVKIWDTANGTCLQTLTGWSGGVCLVVFSYDGKHLASASFDETIKIWDTTNWTCLQTFHTGSLDSNTFSFDQSGSFLHTGIGTFHLGNLSSPRIRRRWASRKKVTQVGLGLSIDRKWIMWDSKKLLWLPPDYRPRCSSITGLTIAIGCNTGQVLILRFSDDIRPTLAQRKSLQGSMEFVIGET